MHAHVTTFQLLHGKMDEVIHTFEQDIIPLVQQQEGCRLITLLTDPRDNNLISIGWWETEAHLLAGQGDSQYQQQMEQMRSVMLAPPVCASYVVHIQVAPI
jgi:quinol monooxygenase YgiN